MTTADWDRVARFVRARRQELGIKQTASTVSPATWSKLENGKQDSYKSFVLAKAAAELDWPTGTIEHIAAGGEPPDDRSPELSERVAQLEAQMAEVLRLLRQQADTPPGAP